MTPDQLDLISRSASVVSERPRPFAEVFYGQLFAEAPATRQLFADDLEEQYGKIVDEISFLAGAADDLDTLVTHARDLGRRHAQYGVVEGHYAPVETALLTALAELLGENWTDDHAQAWQTLYRLIAEVMLEGSSSSLFA